MRQSSIRGRLIGLLLVVLVVAWIGVAAVTYVSAHREVDALLDAHLRQSARMLLAQPGRPVRERDWDDDDDHDDHDEDDGYRSVVAYQLATAEGRVLLRSANAPTSPLSTRTKGFDDVRVRDVRWRVYSSTSEQGHTVVHVAEDHAARERIARHVARNALSPLLVVVPLLAVLLWWAVGKALRPLDRLGEQISRRTAADLGPIGAGPLPAELQPLVDRLDDLFARLRDSIDSERSFTSHAAHELRTPVAALRAQAEVALNAQDPAVRKAALAKCIEGCDRAARLVAQLLLLARADALQALQHVAPCSLEPIAQSVLADVAPNATARGRTVELDTAGDCVVRGDASLLSAMLRNLVENALRHGGEHVSVMLRTEGREVLVCVEDDGPGVAPEVLSQLGQRFYRPASAGGPGSGLGLSIVARIARLHEATVHFGRRSDGTGFAASLRLPAADVRKPG